MSTCVDAGEDIELDCPMDCVSGCTMDIVLDGTAIGDNLVVIGRWIKNFNHSIRTRWPA